MASQIHVLLRDCVRAQVGLRDDVGDLRVRWHGVPDPSIRSRLRAAKIDLIEAVGQAPRGVEDPRWIVRLLAEPDAVIGAWRDLAGLELREHIEADEAGWRAYVDLFGTAAPREAGEDPRWWADLDENPQPASDSTP